MDGRRALIWDYIRMTCKSAKCGIRIIPSLAFVASIFCSFQMKLIPLFCYHTANLLAWICNSQHSTIIKLEISEFYHKIFWMSPLLWQNFHAFYKIAYSAMQSYSFQNYWCLHRWHSSQMQYAELPSSYMISE